MATNKPSSIVCFKNGYSFVNVPVELYCDSSREVKETILGPLPQFVVHGTIGLELKNSENVKILSISKAPVTAGASNLNIPTNGDGDDKSDFLRANIGQKVIISLDLGHGHTLKQEGKIKSVCPCIMEIESSFDKKKKSEFMFPLSSFLFLESAEDGDNEEQEW